MLEKEISAIIKASEKGHHAIQVMRCENIVATGVPDLYICDAGLSYWLEIKAPKPHARHATPFFGGSHPIGPAQFAWHRAHALAGGLSFILASNGRETILLNGAEISSVILDLPFAALKKDPALTLFSCNAPFDKEIWELVKTLVRTHAINGGYHASYK